MFRNTNRLLADYVCYSCCAESNIAWTYDGFEIIVRSYGFAGSLATEELKDVAHCTSLENLVADNCFRHTELFLSRLKLAQRSKSELLIESSNHQAGAKFKVSDRCHLDPHTRYPAWDPQTTYQRIYNLFHPVLSFVVHAHTACSWKQGSLVRTAAGCRLDREALADGHPLSLVQRHLAPDPGIKNQAVSSLLSPC
jgi:hypothetical protein